MNEIPQQAEQCPANGIRPPLYAGSGQIFSQSYKGKILCSNLVELLIRFPTNNFMMIGERPPGYASFETPPKCPELGPRELHIWILESVGNPYRCWQLLSPDERERATRFHKECEANRFIVFRAALRQILGGYLDVPPEAIKLAYTAYGKPFLHDASGSLEFNVSHSGPVALIAMARHHSVGVDIEAINHDFPVAEMAPAVFSPDELVRFSKLPADAKWAEFFRIWVAKEAYLKALGKGLSIEPNMLEVASLPVEIITTVDGFASAISMPTSTPTKIRRIISFPRCAARA